MADIDNNTKDQLETILQMSGGYVLDFNNGSFADFVKTCLGFDPYDTYDGSKAVILRAIWRDRPLSEVAKLNLELLERWVFMRGKAGRAPTPFETQLHKNLTNKFALAPRDATVTIADLAFLERDFGVVDVRGLPKELTSRDVIQARLKEIALCLDAGAPLAVIFLVGSTLEGLLLELAKAKPAEFTGSSSAPSDREGRVKPLDSWTLAELIQVAHSLRIVGADVHGHVDKVRNFRNYIHPRQQMREGFQPRQETARIAQQVLLAAMRDFQALADQQVEAQ